MRREYSCLVPLAFAVIFLTQMQCEVVAAGKSAPESFSESEFKAIVQQSLGNSAGPFGAAGDVKSGTILDRNGSYLFTFAHASIGLTHGVSVMDFLDKIQSQDGETCVQSKGNSRDIPSRRGVILFALSYSCTKDGAPIYIGFVNCGDERTKVSHFFWVRGSGLPESAVNGVRDGIFDRMKTAYAN